MFSVIISFFETLNNFGPYKKSRSTHPTRDMELKIPKIPIPREFRVESNLFLHKWKMYRCGSEAISMKMFVERTQLEIEVKILISWNSNIVNSSKTLFYLSMKVVPLFFFFEYLSRDVDYESAD